MSLFTDRPPEEVAAEEAADGCPNTPSPELQAELNKETLAFFERMPDSEKLNLTITAHVLKGLISAPAVFAVDYSVRAFEVVYGPVPEPARSLMTGLLSLLSHEFDSNERTHLEMHAAIEAGVQAKVSKWLGEWEKSHGFDQPPDEVAQVLTNLTQEILKETYADIVAQFGGQVTTGVDPERGVYIDIVLPEDDEAGRQVLEMLGEPTPDEGEDNS